MINGGNVLNSQPDRSENCLLSFQLHCLPFSSTRRVTPPRLGRLRGLHGFQPTCCLLWCIFQGTFEGIWFACIPLCVSTPLEPSGCEATQQLIRLLFVHFCFVLLLLFFEISYLLISQFILHISITYHRQLSCKLISLPASTNVCTAVPSISKLSFEILPLRCPVLLADLLLAVNREVYQTVLQSAGGEEAPREQ